MLSQWSWFRSQRDFDRWAQQHLKDYFPPLPDRSPSNRRVRTQRDALARFGLFRVQLGDGQNPPDELLDTSGVPTRHAKRQGPGWLTGQSRVGGCTRLGWFQGFRLLLASTRAGWITGFGFGAGHAKEQPLTEACRAGRARPHPRFVSVGHPARGGGPADAGFAGRKNIQRWKHGYGARVICEAGANPTPWPAAWRAWLHPLRQGIESVFAKLFNFCRLGIDRPHPLEGFQAHLAANIALHNFCIWLNHQLDRPPLAFADLLDR